jgi:hypothetical protein
VALLTDQSVNISTMSLLGLLAGGRTTCRQRNYFENEVEEGVFPSYTPSRSCMDPVKSNFDDLNGDNVISTHSEIVRTIPEGNPR